MFVIPIKSLRSKDILTAFDFFFLNSVYEYKKIFTDEGVEFKSNIIKEFYKRKNLHWYTTQNKEIKSGIVERSIQTIKDKIYKYIYSKNTEYYLDVLNIIVDTYNASVHSSLNGRTPFEVHLMRDNEEIIRFQESLYKKNESRNSLVKNTLPLEQVVRLASKTKNNPFFKGYFLQNTLELFKIKKINFDHNPITYEVCDLNNQIVKGSFYKEELVPVEDSGLYDIRVLEQKGTRCKIEYVNYPNSKPKWVKKNSLILRE